MIVTVLRKFSGQLLCIRAWCIELLIKMSRFYHIYVNIWDIFGSENHLTLHLQLSVLIMDTYDLLLSQNRDWDLSYLAMLFSEDFDDYSDLWASNVNDSELVQEMNKLEIYAPVVEDISMDDDTLVHAVEKIENE